MIQDIYQRAAKFAAEKHYNQTVPGSKANYMLHLSNVAMEILVAYSHEPTFNLELAIPIALLHDSIEDAKVKPEDIESYFCKQVSDGVLSLTKFEWVGLKEAQMRDSLKRLKLGLKEARLVKLADRITNLQKPSKHWSNEKKSAYCNESLLIHETLKGENNYLDNRLAEKIENHRQYFV